MKYNFDEIIDRKGSNCLKHDALDNFYGVSDLLPLWIADTEFRVPQFITDAIQERLSHPIFGYTYRSDEFYQSIISWLDKRGNWKTEKEWINFSPGVVAGLSFSVNSMTNVQEGVLIQTPVYPPFADIITMNNRKLITNELIEKDGRYEINFEDFEIKLKESKLFIMCNPHNPVGRVFTKDELTRMGDLCVKYNVIIVSDEIHSDLILKPNKHIHIASISEEIANQTITILAPSKTFNIAGLSTSITIIPNADIRNRFCSETNKFHIDQGNIFGTVALEAAYKNGSEWVDELNDYIGSNIEFVIEHCKMNMPKLKVIKPEATFLLWIDFSALNIDNETLFTSLVKDAKVALNKGSDYGMPGNGFVRLNVGSPLSTIKEALSRIEITYNKFNK